MKLTSDCVSADRTPVPAFIVRLLPIFTPPNVEALAVCRMKLLAFVSIASYLLFNAFVKLF